MSMIEQNTFHANGKLLLSAEYFVLDGALALALPVRFGQSLNVRSLDTNLQWNSKDHKGNSWFDASFHLADFSIIYTSEQAVGSQLQRILNGLRLQNPDFLKRIEGVQVETKLEFPRMWGFGSSSSLIAALAKWANVDPFRLLDDTFGGSGYDIACAWANGPLLYQRNPTPNFVQIPFDPPFKEQLYFVYLGKKQSSREGIARYRALAKQKQLPMAAINALTMQFLKTNTLEDFEETIVAHEQIIAETIQLPRAKSLHFADYWGEIKSLGAWGGDFVLATSQHSTSETLTYFKQKGYSTIFSYTDLILS